MPNLNLGVLCHPTSVNLGDSIQSIAAADLLARDRLPYKTLIDRENSKMYPLDTNDVLQAPMCRCIYNGWFDSAYVQKWPPAPQIDPLFVSFHLNDQAKGKDYNRLFAFQDFSRPSLLSKSFHGYYEKVAPIGCRDLHTLASFQSSGFQNAYFSGCLTMTFVPTESALGERKNTYIVDVTTLNALPSEVVSESTLKTHVFAERTGDETLVEYEQHKFQAARDLLEIYATAKQVWTSRLHCVLPCIAMNTPVIFVADGLENDVRFEGLNQFIPIWKTDVTNWRDHINEDEGKGKNNIWRDLSGKMGEKVHEWITSDGGMESSSVIDTRSLLDNSKFQKEETAAK